MKIKSYLLPWILSVGLLAGCAGTTQHTRFLVLSPQTPETLGGQASPTAGLSIGLGPIKIPDILDRPQIVTRIDNNRLQLAEFHHWAGQLDGTFTRFWNRI